MENNILVEYARITEEALRGYVKEEDVPQKKLYEAMCYSLFAGGKRLRPAIMMMTAKMLGCSPKRVLPFACAMEMIHTYSLIHDDLPAMDNDDLRRGKPTNHKVFGEAEAILAGDALLTKAFEITADCNTDEVDPGRVIKAIKALAAAAGAEGMVGGQIIDIGSNPDSIEKLKHMHLLKTGAIIRASGVIGAILSGASEEQTEAIDGYCCNLGIAFQIQDDILDVCGNEKDLGKNIGSDAENEKSTYVTLCGIEEARALQEEYIEKAKKCLEIFKNTEELSALADMLKNRRV